MLPYKQLCYYRFVIIIIFIIVITALLLCRRYYPREIRLSVRPSVLPPSVCQTRELW